MALLTQLFCPQCQKPKIVSHNSGVFPRICSDCMSENNNNSKSKHLNKLSELSIEERLTKIEEWIYDYKPYREPRY